MKLSDLLENRTNDDNTVYDFSELTREELYIFLNSRIYGEESLSDSEMQLLESGTGKIIERPGKPRKFKKYPVPFDPDKDDPEKWLKDRIAWQQNNRWYH